MHKLLLMTFTQNLIELTINTDWDDDWEDDLDSDDFMNEDPIESDIDVLAELRKILEERA